MKKQSKKDLFLPTIILYEPQIGENIGSVARAMKNCGLYDLRIVKPRDGWTNPKSLSTAVGAIDLIENAKVCSSLNESLKDISFIVSTSARKRFMNKKVEDPSNVSKILLSNYNQKIKSAIIFGPENSGLSNNEISVSDLVMMVPLNKNFSSLNVSQAVLIIAWEFHKILSNFSLNVQGTIPSKKNLQFNLLASFNDRELFFNRLEKLLDEKNFFPTSKMKPKIMRNIKNVFIRAKLSKQELSTFQGIISSMEN